MQIKTMGDQGEKQIKTTKDQGEKQIKASESRVEKDFLDTDQKSIVSLFFENFINDNLIEFRNGK